MSKFIIRRNLFANRCEICHQTDRFNPITNICLRCNNVQIAKIINFRQQIPVPTTSSSLFNFTKSQVLLGSAIGFILFVFVLLAVIPNFLSSGCGSQGASALEAIRLIHSVEATYISGVGKGEFATAKNLYEEQLIDSGLADALGVNGKMVPKSNYIFYLNSTKTGEHPHFVAAAISLDENQRNFYVDETGIVRYCFSPKIPGATSEPIGN